MKRAVFGLSALCFAIAAAAAAQPSTAPGPSVSLRGARVTAPDIEKAAQFYEAAFGMQVVLRVDTPRPAIVLKFGETREQAMADPGGRVMVEQAPPGQGPDPYGHILLNVSDTEQAVKRGVAAGGLLTKPPTMTKRPDMTRVVAYLNDPAGNMVELIEERR